MTVDLDYDKLHEECGVFGIYAPEGSEVAQDIYYGLTALQHRGQESAGISVTDSAGPMGNINTRKDMGLVSEVFSKADLEKLHGNIGVGHVRYSTTGGSIIENAQPMVMNHFKGTLALVHNGNLTNAGELKKKQMNLGQVHYGTSDSEVLAIEIIQKRINTPSIEKAVKEAAMDLKGGFACIVMSPRKLTAVRDPYGLKPLVMGKKGDAWIFASESAAITGCGGELLRDVKPGEMITVTSDGIVYDSLPEVPRKAHCVFEYIYFARTDSVIDGISVNDARMRAGRALARRHSVDADVVAGVPDSGLAAAEGYAKEAGIPFVLAFHKNSYVGRSFIKPTDEERKTAVRLKLSVHESAVKGKRVVIIDDSIVRGNTMRQIIVMLREAGAKEVHVRISSPPFLYPCYYGTDVPTSGQLIASNHSTEAVCESIGADSLGYLAIEDFSSMTGDLPICTACFDNDYPVR